MKSTRFSLALDILQHLAARGRATSSDLGNALGTHSVYVRRVIIGLQAAGLVTRASKKNTDGYLLAKELQDVTLGDVWRASMNPAFFHAHKHETAETARVLRNASAAVVATLHQTRVASKVKP